MRLFSSTLLVIFLGTSIHSETFCLARWEDRHDEEQTCWRITESDSGVNVLGHRRITGVSRSGTRSEYLSIRATGLAGTYVYAERAIPVARVIDELTPRIWLKSDRAGLQILARVVFPRDHDSEGKPISALIRGSLYTEVGSWQLLQIEQVPALVQRQVRALRSQLRSSISGREACINSLLINVLGGEGVTNVWIDSTSLDGFVSADSVIGPHDQSKHTVPLLDSKDTVKLPTRMQGSTLLANGNPFFPRLVDYQGEPFGYLRQLGFNGVMMEHIPSPELLAESRQEGLWVVCPAPRDMDRAVSYDGVLAWDLGHGLNCKNLAKTLELARRVRRSDPQTGRPLIVGPDSDSRAYSRIADVLLQHRLPLGTSFELAHYDQWLQQRTQFAEPGKPFWTSIQTEPRLNLVNHLATISGNPRTEMSLQPRQIRQLALSAVAAGARGIRFTSRARLDLDDAATQLRAKTLAWLNQELELIEAWTTVGNRPTLVDNQDNNGVRFTALTTDRSRLIIPLQVQAAAQFVIGSSGNGPLSFVIPTALASSEAYQLTASGLQPLRRGRVVGGTRVHIDRLDWHQLILTTEDPAVVRHVSQKLRRTAMRTAQLEFELAELNWQSIEQHLPDGQVLPLELTGLRKVLNVCRQTLAAGDYDSAYQLAIRVHRATDQWKHNQWTEVSKSLTTPVSHPCCMHHTSIIRQGQTAVRLSNARLSRNSLPGGDFENLDFMVESGWQQYRFEPPRIVSEVGLSRKNVRSGKHSLRLFASSTEKKSPSIPVESTLVWINSAAVPVRKGQMVCIKGWYYVARPMVDSFDGLLVFDSLGGPAMAERIREGASWQPFILYRKATIDRDITVTLALTGCGEIFVDDVTVHIVLADLAAG